ncbi:MAG: TatD family hydrolase [Pseudomonadota bacterium]
MLLVDSHVNLHSDKYEDDFADVIARARDAGVAAMLTISDKLESTDALRQICATQRNVWRSVGVHPHYAQGAKELQADRLIALASEEDVIGIGECGLDFYYEYSERNDQGPVFEAHIEASQRTQLPLIIHTRDADDQMASLIKARHAEREFTPLLHCYTGGKALAQTALDRGGFIYFYGIITIKKADDIREIAAWAPLDRIIVETDCPYLAPTPKRGRRNEPSFLPYVVSRLAEVRDESVDRIARVVTDNFFQLFAKAQRPSEFES